MSKSSEQAIREFADRWGHLDFAPDANMEEELTALIKEYFVPKEDAYPKAFVDFCNDNFYYDKALGGYVPVTIIYQGNPIKTAEELYKDWKENEQ